MKSSLSDEEQLLLDKDFLKSGVPPVSVVVPMYNESENIGRCLDSILGQSYDDDKVEILVVDGGSTDGSLQILEEYARRHDFIRILSNPRRITPSSLNMGIKDASGEVIIILGAHTMIDQDFIANNIRHMKEKAVKCVGGTQINKGLNYIQQAIGNAMASPFGIMSAPYRYKKNPGYVDTVVYAAYHRSLFDELGYFDEETIIAEDAEFNWRIRQAGYQIFFSPDIVSYYTPRSNLSRLAYQFFRYGILRVNVVKKHVDALKVLHLVPPVFVLLLVVSGLSLFYDGSLGPVFLISVTAYGAYLLIASAVTAGQLGWKYLPPLPLAFMAMQLCFGVGFLVGLFRSKH